MAGTVDQSIPEEPALESANGQALQERQYSPLQTLTSGQRRDVRGGAVQAHACVVACDQDAWEVLEALRQADAFRLVVSWSYAYGAAGQEVIEDGLDEGCGEKLQAVLRRYSLQGLLLVVSRWQDDGATPGLELFGTTLYSIVVERGKDLILNLKQAMGLNDAEAKVGAQANQAAEAVHPPEPKNFDFGPLPALPEPRVQTRYGPRHFLAETSLNRPASLPNLFTGGDVRLWMANDQCLRGLSDTDLVALRSLRQPDWRIEEVLQAVAVLRGQTIRATGTPAARWGQCKEILKSPTFRTELLLFDARQVPPEAADQALTLLDGLDVEDIRRASPGAAALFEWATGVAQWRMQGGPPRTPGPAASPGQGVMLYPQQQKGQLALGAGSDGAKLRRVRSGTNAFSKTSRCAGFGISAPKIRASPSPKFGSTLMR